MPAWAATLWLCTGLLLAFGFGNGLAGRGAMVAMPEDEIRAQSDCERFVRQRLGPQRPTAFAPLHPPSGIRRDGDGLWSVEGEIVAQQGAGSGREGGYRCTLRYARHGALLQSLDID